MQKENKNRKDRTDRGTGATPNFLHMAPFRESLLFPLSPLSATTYRFSIYLLLDKNARHRTNTYFNHRLLARCLNTHTLVLYTFIRRYSGSSLCRSCHIFDVIRFFSLISSGFSARIRAWYFLDERRFCSRKRAAVIG